MIIDVLFDGPPDKVMPRFVDVENEHGESIRVGEWIQREDGKWGCCGSIWQKQDAPQA